MELDGWGGLGRSWGKTAIRIHSIKKCIFNKKGRKGDRASKITRYPPPPCPPTSSHLLALESRLSSSALRRKWSRHPFTQS